MESSVPTFSILMASPVAGSQPPTSRRELVGFLNQLEPTRADVCSSTAVEQGYSQGCRFNSGQAS